jgi:hypothetical protein
MLIRNLTAQLCDARKIPEGTNTSIQKEIIYLSGPYDITAFKISSCNLEATIRNQ